MAGLRLHVNNLEDLILIDEILCSNAYNFGVSGEVCVIDVGMNVGIASLFFASRPDVRVVHSFEPFSRPFARALKNFSLNPEIGPKIRPNQLGLAGAPDVLEVPVYENATIGASIRGWKTGTVLDKISIRDASEVFRPIIQEAVRANQTVVVKLDCEGSEFAILESLEQNDLLRDIALFLGEIHHWWSPEKSHKDIAELLVANGFAIFDFYRAEAISSAFYAVRQVLAKGSSEDRKERTHFRSLAPRWGFQWLHDLNIERLIARSGRLKHRRLGPSTHQNRVDLLVGPGDGQHADTSSNRQPQVQAAKPQSVPDRA